MRITLRCRRRPSFEGKTFESGPMSTDDSGGAPIGSALRFFFGPPSFEPNGRA
jgi:hypothetical protein